MTACARGTGLQGRTAVQLAGVGKCYGPVRAVDGLDLRIAAGEVVALLGPTAPASRRRST